MNRNYQKLTLLLLAIDTHVQKEHMVRLQDQQLSPVQAFVQGMSSRVFSRLKKSFNSSPILSPQYQRGYFCPVSSIHPLPCSAGAYSTGGAADCTSCNLPSTVPIDIIESICRDDRSCCLDAFDYNRQGAFEGGERDLRGIINHSYAHTVCNIRDATVRLESSAD